MPLFTLAALSTGTWSLLGLIGAFTLLGLAALMREPRTAPQQDEATRYTFGLGLNPRLVALPEARDIPATHDPLGDKGLRSLASDAGAKTGFTTGRYRLPDGQRRPYELSEDLPDGIEAIELLHEDLTVWLDRDGTLTASRPLEDEQRRQLEALLEDVETHGDLRADRREWDAASHTARDANRHRV